MPDQDVFDSFDTHAVPSRPLPAAEVRRRGDRMRRRRHGAVTLAAAAAVAVVAVGGVALGQGGDGRSAPPPVDSPDPTPSATETPSVVGPTTIPADFPIDTEGSAPEPPPEDYLAQQLEFCGERPLAGAAPVDARSAQVAGGETNTAVTLLLFDDARGARAAARTLLRSAGACPQEVTNVVGDIEVLPASADWPGRTVRTAFPQDARYVHAVQAGPALLLSSWYVAGAPAEEGLLQSRDALAEQLAAMDDLWDVPGWEPTAGSSASPDATEGGARTPATSSLPTGGGIPAGFPLGVAHEDLTGDGGTVTGPGPDVLALQDEPVCGDTLWTVGATGRLGFSATGPAAYADVRELRSYADAEQAIAQMADIRSRFAGCDRERRGGSTIVWTTYEEDTGWDSVTFGSTYEEGLGGGVFQVTRVGRAVVAVMRGGEWSTETAPDGAAELTALTRRLAPEMCTFTEAGC